MAALLLVLLLLQLLLPFPPTATTAAAATTTATLPLLKTFLLLCMVAPGSHRVQIQVAKLGVVGACYELRRPSKFGEAWAWEV